MKSFAAGFFTSALGAMFGVAVVGFFALIILPIVFTLMIGAGKRGAVEPIKNNSILHLEIRGQLTERLRPLDFEIFGERSIFTEDRTMGLYDLNRAIDLAKNDKRISGIYLEIGGFDAGWASVTALRRHIEDFAKSGKFVYAHANRLDELGFYLASAANQVFMEPHGEIEFNGLGMTEMFFKGLFDKLGLEPKVFRVGKFKAAIEPLIRDGMSPENREQTKALIGDLWEQVRGVAAKTSKADVNRIDQLAEGLEIVSAETAKRSGLVQELAFADEVEDKLKKFTVGDEDEDLPFVRPGRLLREAVHHTAKKKIAVIFAEGEIVSGSGGRDSIGADDLRADVLDATADDDVAAIVLRVNSPGGDALASDVIWRELRITDDDIPVVVSMSDVAASGGYYIAAAGRYIFAEPTTITGSIGVFGILFNSEKFFKSKTGISFDRVVTHSHADLGSMARPMTEFEAKTIQSDVERVYKRFLDVVQEGRGYEKREDLESIAEGRVWSGTKAKELGLVDELGGLDQAIAKAAEFAELKDYQVEIFPHEGDPFRRLIGRLTGDAMASWLVKNTLPFEAWRQLLGPVEKIPVQGLRNGVYARMLFDLKVK